MAVVEVAAEGIAVFVRLLGWLLIDLFVEAFLGETGRLILRSRSRASHGGAWCIFVGFVFWLAVCAAGVSAWHFMSA